MFQRKNKITIFVFVLMASVAQAGHTSAVVHVNALVKTAPPKDMSEGSYEFEVTRVRGAVVKDCRIAKGQLFAGQKIEGSDSEQGQAKLVVGQSVHLKVRCVEDDKGKSFAVELVP